MNLKICLLVEVGELRDVAVANNRGFVLVAVEVEGEDVDAVAVQALFLRAAGPEHVVLASLAFAEVDHDVGDRLAGFVGALPEDELAGAKVVQDFASRRAAACFAEFAVFFEPAVLIVRGPWNACVTNSIKQGLDCAGAIEPAFVGVVGAEFVNEWLAAEVFAGVQQLPGGGDVASWNWWFRAIWLRAGFWLSWLGFRFKASL